MTGSRARATRSWSASRSRSLLAAVVLLAALATWQPSAATAGPAIRVEGNHLVDGSGSVVVLRGVNRPGTEYRCTVDGYIHGDWATDGLRTWYAKVVVDQIAADWHGTVNALRIPLNQDCWLGGRGTNPFFSGAGYRQFIQDEVAEAIGKGMYPILDLHWSSAGPDRSLSQDVDANRQYDIEFWTQVAETFKSQPAVLFELYNEPHVWCRTTACQASYPTAATAGWALYRDGGTYTYAPGDVPSTGRSATTIDVAGTQQLVDAIRGTGASNVVIVDGLGWANALDYWSAYKPVDPLDQLAIGFHTYPSSGATVDNGLDNLWSNTDYGPNGTSLGASYPWIITEFGEPCGQTQARAGFAQRTMDWADAHGVSWTAWGWDAGENCNGPSLVTDNNTGATTAYGAAVKAQLAADAAQP